MFFEGEIEVETADDSMIRAFTVEYLVSRGYAATRHDPGESDGLIILSMVWSDTGERVTDPHHQQQITNYVTNHMSELI